MLTGQPRFQSGWQLLRVVLILGNCQHVHTHTHILFLFLGLVFSFSFASHHLMSLVSSLPWSMIITATESYGAQGTKPSSGLASSSLYPIFSTR